MESTCFRQERDKLYRILFIRVRPFSFPRVLRCPAGIDRGREVISGFGRPFKLCDTRSLYVMLYQPDTRHDEFRLSLAKLL